MGIFTNTEFNSLEDLLVDQLKDLYDAENRLVDALQKMADAATTPSLREAFSSHLLQTRNHVTRLEQGFNLLGIQPARETCQAMKGLIAEGSQVIDAKGNLTVRDAALIAAAQRVEHYEMAGYGSARTFAEQLDLPDLAELLQSTLDEEGDADEKLTELALNEVNVEAIRTYSPTV
jgi:ferritin-like metal-binding protein YciE